MFLLIKQKRLLAILICALFLGAVISALHNVPFIRHIKYDSTQEQIIIQKNILALVDDSLKFSSNDDLLEYYFACKPNSIKSDYEIKVNNKWINLVKLDKENNLVIIKANQPVIFEAALENSSKTVTIKPLSPAVKYDKIVILDAGHGGVDYGAIVNDINEKDINFAIVKKTYDLLLNNGSGIKPYLVHVSDKTVTLTERSGYGNDFADLFVSVHSNTFADSQQPHGTQTFYDQNEQNFNGRSLISGENLASIMQQNLVEKLASRDRGIAGDSEFMVLIQSEVPSVLIEVGYMTNPDELSKLTSPEYQQLAAQAIYEGIVEAFEQR